MEPGKKPESVGQIASIDEARSKSGYPQFKRDVTEAALRDRRFYFPYNAMKLLWHLIDKTPIVDGVPSPVRANQGELGLILGIDKYSMSKTVHWMVEHGMLRVDAKKINFEVRHPSEWTDCPAKAAAKKPEVGENPTPVGQYTTGVGENTTERVGENPTSVGQYTTPETPRVGQYTTPVGQYTTQNAGNEGTERVSGTPIIVNNHDINHGVGHVNDISNSGSQDTHAGARDGRTNEALLVLAREMLAMGYVLPANKGMLGLTPEQNFKRALEKTFLSRHFDGVNDFKVEPWIYVTDFMAPTVRDCPAPYRGDYAHWSKQFTFALAGSRKAGSYVNHWATAPKVEKPDTRAVGDFSHVQGGGQVVDQRALRAKLRGEGSVT